MQRAQCRGRHTTTLFLHLRKYAQSVLFRRFATPGETPSANYLLPYNSEKAAKLAHARCNFVCGGAREKQQHPIPRRVRRHLFSTELLSAMALTAKTGSGLQIGRASCRERV